MGRSRHESDMKNAQDILERILKNPRTSVNDALANDLLREFHRGRPVHDLRRLLLASDVEITKIGVWIVSELGEKASSLLPEIARMLTHDSRDVRFWAIDAMLMCATPRDGRDLAVMVSRAADDSDEAVRWKAMDIMARASIEQLTAALRHLEQENSSSIHIAGLRWLVGSCGWNYDEINSLLQSDSPILRKYGAIAAARAATIIPGALGVAILSEDEDVKRFAQDWRA